MSLLGMGATMAGNYAMSQMFKPQGYNIGQLQNTLAPQLQAGNFQKFYGRDMMNPMGAYQSGIAGNIGLQNRYNMFAKSLLNQRSMGQYNNPAMSAKVNQGFGRDVDQNTSQTLASMLPQLTQQGMGMYQQGVGNTGSYLQNIAQAQLSNRDISNASRGGINAYI